MYFSGSIGRITDYVRTVQLEQNWQKKKIELSAAKSEDTKRADDWIKAKRIEDIKNKMKAGRRLSYDEKEFLRINAPDLYEKAMKIERERDEFRRALEKCKTKEEARRLQAAKAMELQTEAQATSVKFKDGKERDESEFIAMRMMAIFDEFADFTKSKEYAELSNESDEIKEENEENEEDSENIMENSEDDEENENVMKDSEDDEKNGNVENGKSSEKSKKGGKSKFKKIKVLSNEQVIIENYKLNMAKVMNRPHSKFTSSTTSTTSNTPNPQSSSAITSSYASSVNKLVG